MNVKGLIHGANGQATVDFATFLQEDKVTVSRSGLTSNSIITANIYADTDDVVANDWEPVIINNITTSGFDIILRCVQGDYLGNVLVNWSVS